MSDGVNIGVDHERALVVKSPFDVSALAGEDQPMGGAAPARGRIAEVDEGLGSRLVNLKGLVRPAGFSGRTEDWAEFRFRLESAATLMGLDYVMERAVIERGWQMDEKEMRSSRYLRATRAVGAGQFKALAVRSAPGTKEGRSHRMARPGARVRAAIGCEAVCPARGALDAGLDREE